MKKTFKSILILSLCAICAVTCIFFVACIAPDYKSFYNDLDKIIERGNSQEGDFTSNGFTYEIKNDNIYNNDVSHIWFKDFSGVKTINVININDKSENCVERLMFTKFNMSKGKLKIAVVKKTQRHAFVYDEFTPANDGLCEDWSLTGLNMTGEVEIKIVGADADFEFELMYVKADGGEINPPDPPTPPVTESNFVKIKTAYENAGYEVDLKSDSVDPNIATLINTMQQMYEKLGYGMCFIGKNLDNAINMELYMLISADSEASAEEFAAGLSGYKNKQSGKDIIVSLNVMLSSPNFAPFEQATA